MKKINSSIFLVIIISIIVGFLSGILGWLVLGVNILNLPFLSQYNFSNAGNNNNNNRQIVIDQPRSVIVQQDLQLVQLQNNLLPAMVNIYNADNTVGEPYLPSQILGQGFVLTADGWIVTTGDAIKDLKAKYKVVGYQGKEYEFGNFVQDKATGLIFGKINANNLTVANIGSTKDIQVGQTVALISQRDRLNLEHISKIGYSYASSADIPQSSETMNKKIFLDTDLDQSYNGAVVASLKGQILGIEAGNGIILTDYFSNIVNSVLSNTKISRAELGVTYIDLAQVEGMNLVGDKGALLTVDPDKASTVSGKLKKGDIIKKVNDTELNDYISLSEVINIYHPGDKVELQFLRDGKAQSVNVVLN